MNIFTIFNFLIGGCLASHACVIYDRYRTGNYIFGHSKCANCQLELSLLEEIPIFSYLFLKGKCQFCHSSIPATLFFTELIGSFSFLALNLFSFNGICTAIFLFFLLVAAIFDYYEREFPTILLFPAFVIILITKISAILSWTLFDLINFLPLTLFMTIQVFRKKFGSGDLLIYILIAFYFTPSFANNAYLIASLLLLMHYLLKKDSEFAFVPYIYLGVIMCLMA